MWFLLHFFDAVSVASQVVAAAAAVAALTPSPKDDSAVAAVRKVVDFVGFNFGHASNK